MNISRSQLESYVRIYREQIGKIYKEEGKDKLKSNSTDSVILSAQARKLQNAVKSAGTDPDIRQEKVAELKEKITSGTYNIDGELVAEKMLEEYLGGMHV